MSFPVTWTEVENRLELSGGTSVVGEDVQQLVEVVGNIDQLLAIEVTIAIMV